MKRRTFLKTAGAGLMGLATGCSTPVTTTKQPLPAGKRKPNIIYILADDLGYGDLSCYGQTKFITPNIDSLSERGMTFTDHYAGCTVCAPSRASLMTGVHTGHCLVRGNYETGPDGFGGELPLRPEDQTIGKVLKKAGYKTAVIGKWGMGMNGTTGEPNKQGFDHFYGILNQARAHYYYPDFMWRNGKKIRYPGNRKKQTHYAQDLFTDESLKFIEDNKTNPFFLFLAYTTPHAELLVPEDSLRKYKGRYKETPYKRSTAGGDGSSTEALGVYAAQEAPRAAFAAMIDRLDRDVGRIVAKIKELDLTDDTVIIFSSDNGPHKEGGADPDFFNSNGPLRGYKRDLYEGGIRVPMIVCWPNKVWSGSKTRHVSAFWDILPTCAEIAGTEAPKGINGISFLPTLLKRAEYQRKHLFLYWEFHERGYTEQAVRMGLFKAVRRGPGQPVELYDLVTDVGETKDVAAKNPEVCRKIKAYLNSARTPSKLWPLKFRK